MTMASRTIAGMLAGSCLAAGACINTPQYLEPQQTLEVLISDMGPIPATAQLILPIRPETAEEAAERAQLQTELGVTVPVVTLDDLSISIEWTIKNLEAQDGEARVHVNGGNEAFFYVPLNFVIDPQEDEEPPPLLGDIPLLVPANGTISGVFREDQLREAAVDWELVTRGGLNPFAAILQYHGNVDEIPDAMGGVLPRAALGHLVRYDLVFEANRHMVLEYEIRIRDHQDILHERLLAAPAGETIPFMPAEFVPPPPPEPQP